MDKPLELKLFRYIYGQPGNWSTMLSESPDFICTGNNEPIFGVEVTELYRNESDARLKNVNGYALSLLNGGDYLHKDDKKNIRVERVIYTKKGENEGRKINAIIQDYNSFDENTALLINAIKNKEEKIDEYLCSCSEVDLVINDASKIFSFDKFKNFFFPFSRSIETRVIISSQFREIFLVTNKKEQSSVKIPLKLNLFAQDINIFENLIRNSDVQKKICDAKQVFRVLFYCLYKSGYEKIPVATNDGCIGLTIGCHQYLYSPEGKHIYDYSTIPEQLPKGQLLGEFIKEIGEPEKQIATKILEERKNYSSCLKLFFEVEGN